MLIAIIVLALALVVGAVWHILKIKATNQNYDLICKLYDRSLESKDALHQRYQAVRAERDDLETQMGMAIEAMANAKKYVNDKIAARLDFLIRTFVDKREEESIDKEIKEMTKVETFRAGQEG